MDFWQLYSTAPVEVKLVFYTIIGLIVSALILVVIKKGVQFKHFKFGGKDRYLTARETIEAMQEAFGIIEERSDIKNNLRIKDQLDFADQENIFIKDLLTTAFEEMLKNVTDKIPQKSLKNYTLVVETLLKELTYFSKKYFKAIKLKGSETELKKEIENPNSELYKKIERRVKWSIAKITETLSKHYNEDDVIPIKELLKKNKEIAPRVKDILVNIVINGYIIHGQYNDRIKELNNSLNKYTDKLSN